VQCDSSKTCGGRAASTSFVELVAIAALALALALALGALDAVGGALDAA
jgi:hypothetical protein